LAGVYKIKPARILTTIHVMRILVESTRILVRPTRILVSDILVGDEEDIELRSTK
jgi:hypothetical protein